MLRIHNYRWFSIRMRILHKWAPPQFLLDHYHGSFRKSRRVWAHRFHTAKWNQRRCFHEKPKTSLWSGKGMICGIVTSISAHIIVDLHLHWRSLGICEPIQTFWHIQRWVCRGISWKRVNGASTAHLCACRCSVPRYEEIANGLVHRHYRFFFFFSNKAATQFIFLQAKVVPGKPRLQRSSCVTYPTLLSTSKLLRKLRIYF